MKPNKIHKNALTRVHRHFPDVERVRDSRRTIMVRVKPEDAKKGSRKDPRGCALARACVREHIADGAIIGMAYSYLIKGKIATRYKTSNAIQHEIVSFDRHQDFQPGLDYKLSKVSAANRLGVKKWLGRGPHLTKKPDTDKVHKTANVRILK